MIDSFKDLFDAAKKNRKYCNWVSKVSSEEYSKELVDESKEIAEAIKNKDDINLTEEIGDLLWDTITFAIIAEDEGKINTKDVIKTVIQKFKERKPHIFEERIVSEEEGKKLWNEAKVKQKFKK